MCFIIFSCQVKGTADMLAAALLDVEYVPVNVTGFHYP